MTTFSETTETNTMQTQTHQTETTPPGFTPEVEAARAELLKLQSAADDAEAEAKRWATTFEREPTEQAFSTKAITAQRAKNARAAADSFDRETLRPLIQRQLETERSAVAKELDANERAALEKFDAAIGAIVEGLHQLDGAIAAHAALHLPRHKAQLAGVSCGKLSLAAIVAGMNAELAEFNGTPHEIDTKRALIRYDGSSGQHTPVTIQINRPAGHVPTPIR